MSFIIFKMRCYTIGLHLFWFSTYPFEIRERYPKLCQPYFSFRLPRQHESKCVSQVCEGLVLVGWGWDSHWTSCIIIHLSTHISWPGMLNLVQEVTFYVWGNLHNGKNISKKKFYKIFYWFLKYFNLEILKSKIFIIKSQIEHKISQSNFEQLLFITLNSSRYVLKFCVAKLFISTRKIGYWRQHVFSQNQYVITARDSLWTELCNCCSPTGRQEGGKPTVVVRSGRTYPGPRQPPGTWSPDSRRGSGSQGTGQQGHPGRNRKLLKLLLMLTTLCLTEKFSRWHW